jgi:hypothetical protein
VSGVMRILRDCSSSRGEESQSVPGRKEEEKRKRRPGALNMGHKSRRAPYKFDQSGENGWILNLNALAL